MPEAQTILAFDYGTQRIGVAVGQTVTATARGLTTLQNKNHNLPDWQAIAALLAEWQPALCVVGLPLQMDGGEQEMTRFARRFANQLHGRFGLPVDTMDERLSSYEAEQILAEKHRHHGYN
ncbi:MAG: Holliday junction resolvase RuvX, partial [Anaerolineae bacterium]|nr:Holliday junction resolvase RuvX [Anaerolineae bacterium]